MLRMQYVDYGFASSLDVYIRDIFILCWFNNYIILTHIRVFTTIPRFVGANKSNDLNGKI